MRTPTPDTLMKSLPVLLCAFLLTSCITVDDFGDTWGRAVIDPGLIGHWQVVQTSVKTQSADVDEVVITAKDGTYAFAGYSNGKKKDDSSRDSGRTKTLKIGPYLFLATRHKDKSGDMWRYKIDGTVFKICADTHAVKDFIEDSYPDTDNLTVKDIPAFKNDNDGSAAENALVHIKILNDQSLKILAAIPDNETYWSCDTEFEKIQ
jgi:hypothetical protein